MVLYVRIVKTSGGSSVDVEGMVKQPKVVSSIGENNAASTFTCLVDNQAGKNKDLFNINDDVDVYIGTSQPATQHIFSGFVTVTKYKGQGSEKETITVTAKDYWTRLQDKTIEPDTYRNQEVSSIVTDLVNRNLTDITTNNVNTTGISLPAVTYKHNRLDEAITNLAKGVNFISYVDVDKDLHFEEKNAISNGVKLESGVNIISTDFDEKRSKMANSIWVYGNKILTGAPTYSAVSDGIGSVYTLPEKPHNTQVTVEGSVKNGNVFEFSANPTSGTDYLVDFDEKNIIFVSGTNAGDNIPASGDTINIVYDRDSIIAKFGTDDDSIFNYGRKEDVIVDDSISTTQQAQSVLNAELAERANPFKQGTVTVKGADIINVGRTVEVSIPYHKIDAVYNVLEVTYDLNPKALFSEVVQTVKVAKKIKNIVDTIKDLLAQLRSQGTTNIDIGTLLSIVKFTTADLDIEHHWDVYTRNIGDSFILGNATQGVLGTVASGIQPVLGNQTGSYELQASGGDF